MISALWHELFPDVPLPDTSAAVVEALAVEVRALRTLADCVVTTAVEREASMQSHETVQMVHDVLRQLLLDQSLFDVVVDRRSQPEVKRWADALCWVLKHEHNPTFAARFADIRAMLAALGFEIYQYPEMQNREETK